jgi:hypothetical protein
MWSGLYRELLQQSLSKVACLLRLILKRLLLFLPYSVSIYCNCAVQISEQSAIRIARRARDRVWALGSKPPTHHHQVLAEDIS